jgi:hypothetical protein
MGMRSFAASIAVACLGGLVLGFASVTALLPDAPQGIGISQDEYGRLWPFAVPEGRLRCEGAGAVILSLRGKDYAVNGLASTRYASIQPVYKENSNSVVDVGAIISRGLTLCKW